MDCVFVNLGKQYGGAEKYLFSIIDKWNQKGNSFRVIALKNTRFYKEAKKRFSDDNVFGVNYTANSLKFIKENLSKKKPDVININGINSGIFIYFLHMKVYKVTTVHSNAYMDRSDKNVLIRRLFVKLENFLLNRSDRIIVVSQALKELLIDRGIKEDKIIYIPNGVRIISYPVKNYRDKPSDILKICYVGRLEKVKGCEVLIRALSLLKSNNYKCDIYGDGSLRNKLIEEVNNLSLENKVSFKGFSEKVRNDLNQYDVEVIPSEYEGFPLIIPEAMNAKCLLVCSNVGGIPYIINDGVNGFLFNKNNVLELSEKIDCIDRNPNKAKTITEQAYMDFLDSYTEDKMTGDTIDVLENL